MSAKNLFCRSSDLTNEASVESFFVLRLLAELGYDDKEIKTKEAIQQLAVPKGSGKELYKPDFVLVSAGKPRWLIDAKATTERIEQYTYQCAGYALQINRKYADRPCRYYMLTNGLLTRVYLWDQEEAQLSLRFEDFVKGNVRFAALRKLLGATVAREGWPQPAPIAKTHTLRRPEMDVVKRAFTRCHRIIWKGEKMSKEAAFLGFAKLLFVKLWEDRRLRDDPSHLAAIGRGDPLPGDVVRFSSQWIKEQEVNDPSPVDGILFRQLVQQIESEIVQLKRKRIFEPNEGLGISPGTIKQVVSLLEDFYLFGIDEDLNGRMFESFLTATMRGQDLGQYFTPRSIVKLMTRLAAPIASRETVERVLDGCCGTGGFLIEVLTEMRRQVYENTSLTTPERKKLLNEVANQAIFGIDAGRKPPVARISRINMYLHGDGGSRVYMADALQVPPQASEADPVEARNEVVELRKLLETTCFDVVLTNPPFSMDYSDRVPEDHAILLGYTLADHGDGKRRGALRSSVMFLERYWQLLRPGGRLLTVIDDSVLGGKRFDYVRDFIRERFIIRGIISLHGDAFQRAGARAKTSILYLTKRVEEGSAEEQPAAFVYESRYIGLDDVVPKTRESVAARARADAQAEMDEIAESFGEYLAGKKGEWLVPAAKLTGRLDAKFLRPWTVTRLEPTWKEAGVGSSLLEALVDPVEETMTLDPETRYTFVKVTYQGRVERGDQALGKEISYQRLGRTKPGDIVVSHINAVNKAIGVVPEGMGDLLVSNEYTALRVKADVEADPLYLWAVLRSPAVIAEWISSASGVGRHRVDWELLRQQRIPLLDSPKQTRVGDFYRQVLQHEQEIWDLREAAAAELVTLDLSTADAVERLVRAKPPK